MKMSTVIKDEDGAWVAVDTAETPMGSMTDSATLDRDTLVLGKRSIKQGGVAVNLEFTGNQATGTMKMNDKEQPVAAELGGPVFADAAGAQQVIGLLPLAEGYTTTYRNFDPQTRKEKLMHLAVTGVESVTVPAGTFASYKVELSSADGGRDKSTLWVSQEGRQAVKISTVLPQANGAVMTMELLP